MAINLGKMSWKNLKAIAKLAKFVFTPNMRVMMMCYVQGPFQSKIEIDLIKDGQKKHIGCK